MKSIILQTPKLSCWVLVTVPYLSAIFTAAFVRDIIIYAAGVVKNINFSARG